MQSAQQLRQLGASGEQIVVGDLLERGEVLDQAMEGADALVIATSAVPQIKPLSLIPVLLAKLPFLGGDGPPPRPQFTFKAGQMPEQIDWEGQKAQIDAAKKAGLQRVRATPTCILTCTQPCRYRWHIQAPRFLILAWLRRWWSSAAWAERSGTTFSTRSATATSWSGSARVRWRATECGCNAPADPSPAPPPPPPPP